MSPPTPTDALVALSRLLTGEDSVSETLAAVSDIAAGAVTGADHVSVSLERKGRPVTAAATGGEARRMDESQYASAAGPCLDAWHRAQVVRVDDVGRVVDRYPAFARAAAERGIRSSLSLPLPGAERVVGSLNLYGRTPAGFSQGDEATAATLAAAAGVAVAYDAARELSHHLGLAMDSRAVIEQAKGVLMATSPTATAEEAFELLRLASQRENVKLRDIARRIVGERGSGAPLT